MKSDLFRITGGFYLYALMNNQTASAMRSIALCLSYLFILGLLSCMNESKSTQDGVHFGEPIDESGAHSIHQVMDQLKDEDQIETTMVGTVSEVCQKKGCWMSVYEREDQPEVNMFVTFKDYGFFVPIDLAGKKVVMKGLAYKDITSVDALRHYAEDSGASEEEIAAITSPKEEYKFEAIGVKILN